MIRIPIIQIVDIGGDKKAYIATNNTREPLGSAPINPEANPNIRNSHPEEMTNIKSVHTPIFIQIFIFSTSRARK
jgi:hypothetical protein